MALAARETSSLVALAGMQPAVAATAPASAAAKTALAARPAVPGGENTQRFLTMYDKIHDPANGYFSPQGIPYHSVETPIVEAPDCGHETTSQAYSFWVRLEPEYRQARGDWAPLNNAGATLEKCMIPAAADQPTNSFYNPSQPATYAGEFATTSGYPATLNAGVSVGVDPIANELKSTYGTSDIYGMHWLADVDNKYGFGATPGTGCELGPTATGTSCINTLQRGEQESVWETIPQPACEEFKYGGKNGFLDLFTGGLGLREPVEVHRRPRRRRSRDRGRLLGQHLGDAAGQGCGRRRCGCQGREDGRRPAPLPLRQVLQDGRLHLAELCGRHGPGRSASRSRTVSRSPRDEVRSGRSPAHR